MTAEEHRRRVRKVRAEYNRQLREQRKRLVEGDDRRPFNAWLIVTIDPAARCLLNTAIHTGTASAESDVRDTLKSDDWSLLGYVETKKVS